MFILSFQCSSFERFRKEVLELWRKNIPVCLEVLLTCGCKDTKNVTIIEKRGGDCDDTADFLLEKWSFSINHRRSAEPLFFNFVQLLNAIRSQLYFSQLIAWLTTQEDEKDSNSWKITNRNLRYRLTLPGETFESSKFIQAATKHDFPLTDVGNGFTATVSVLSLPRMNGMPNFLCRKCQPFISDGIVDDRMHTNCTLKGKHRCEDFEDVENHEKSSKTLALKRLCGKKENPSTSSKLRLTVDIYRANAYYRENEKNLLNSHKNDLKIQDKGKILLDAIERSGMKSTKESCDALNNCVQEKDKNGCSDNGLCDMSESDISSIKDKYKYDDVFVNCDSPIPKNFDINDEHAINRKRVKKKLIFDKESSNINKNDIDIPSASEQAKFRKDLDHAASMVFHSRTGLPLTSSPAPVRRGKTCFDFDSSINSVSAIKR